MDIYEHIQGVAQSDLCHRKQNTRRTRLSSKQMAAECPGAGQYEGGSGHSYWVLNLEDVTSQVSNVQRRGEKTQRRRRRREKKGAKLEEEEEVGLQLTQ